MHQTVDIRVRGARRFFIDHASEQEHMARIQAFRDALPPNVRYAVGPGSVVECKPVDGKPRLLGAGSAISVEDVDGGVGWPDNPSAAAPWQIFKEHVQEERIIENYRYEHRLEGDPNLPAPGARR